MNELHYQIDLLKAMNQKLTERERMYARVCEEAEEAVLYCSFESKMFFSLGPWKSFFDFEIRQSSDLTRILEEVDETSAMSLRELLFLEKQGEESAVLECRLKGGDRWLRFTGKASYDREGAPVDKILYIRNITGERTRNDELSYLAYYDSLTGLYNRGRFLQLLEEYVENASAANCPLSVMMIDIDEFRKVRDGAGAASGDTLLSQFGDFLKELCGQHVIGCHLQGDVFCLAVYEPYGDGSVDALYRKIWQRTQGPFRDEEGRKIRITVSIGVAEYPEAADSAEELLNRAESAVYRCKRRGKNGLQYFDLEALKEYKNAVALENRLQEAIFQGEFSLRYQPQYYAGNRRLRGMEALIRWKDGMPGPDQFIPAAERSGAIDAIGKWVLEESVSQYAKWRRQFGFPMILSINISTQQYKQESFAELLVEVLNRYKVKPAEIELEIREELEAGDIEQIEERLKVLKNYGVRISLDDFGAGMSSLTFLKELPIDTLKLDKKLLDAAPGDSSTRAVTESVIQIARSLGMDTVAEGVEDEQLYQYLHSVGCNVIQGYLFGAPMTPEEFEKMLSEK
ncbi:MAG: bifunctional diguanylate cyclase/phosphodiesterase [Roseburia sp.]|nr:bifunctional diguanylate cyclase/phosphodiesterase [Roseburia sp.]MCM1097365.1 bifunctional diguanylate cyclase/phosphodiesterase [Ruminococcus flavefaciens]